MVAAGRKLQLSYFDHPPIAWWMAWGAAHLAGSESPVVVRLPFIALFALTTCLMYRVTSALFGPPAGLWAAVVLNLAPVFGITAATWVLPDGPLLAALLGAAACLIAALRSEGRAAWGWWLGAGACAGLALCSKYSAAADHHRRRRLSADRADEPPLAGAAASLCRRLGGFGDFLPGPDLECRTRLGLVPVSGRPGERRLPPVRADRESRRRKRLSCSPGYGLPWSWCGLSALRRGPRDRERWLLVCLAAPPIIVFTAASLWGNVLFHWAAPGYLMLLPLLGDAVARHWRTSRAVRIWLAATAAFVVLGAALVCERSQVQLAARADRGFSARQGPEPRYRRLDLAADRTSPTAGSSTGRAWSSRRCDGRMPERSTMRWAAGSRSSASAPMRANMV